jgi:magnesium-protoporphyrin IX monomethyl ester (oxidative) cyclase
MSSLAQAPIDRMTSESTRIAMKDTLLTPRFYTTDFDEMDRIDVSAIRPQWEALMDEFRGDSNTFQRPADLMAILRLPPALYRIHRFLISSITSEFRVALYAEITAGQQPHPE